MAEQKRRRGRPSAFKPEYVEQAEKLCRLGATDIEVADFFGVTDRTIYRWQAEFPEFCQALKAGKSEADDRVERSLYHRANGYSFESEKVFQFQGKIVRAQTREHVPPDTTACIFWLKNRRPDEWRDKLDHEHSGKNGGPIEIKRVERIVVEPSKSDENASDPDSEGVSPAPSAGSL